MERVYGRKEEGEMALSFGKTWGKRWLRESHSCFNMLDIARLRVLNSMQLILLTYVSLQKWCYKKNGGSRDKFRVVG
jgi:hypothetical protein